MALLASLVTRLSLESSSFSTGMKRARRQAQDDTGAIRKSLDSINGQLRTFGQGLQIAAVGAAAKRALEYASSLGEVAQQLGITAKELQTFRYIGSQVGIATEQMDTAMGKLSANIGKAAAGSQQQAKFFSAMGINIRDANGHVKTAGQVTLELADKLEKVKDPAQRAAAEVTAYGKAGQKLDTMLAGGSRAINQMAQEAEKLGLVLSNEQIQNADALADKLSALKQVLEARIAGTIADNAQSILSLANSLAALATGLARFWAQNPARALGVIGGIAGAKTGARFGLPGAAIGAVAGYIAGSGMAPDTPQSLRQQAAMFQRNAKQNASAYGYYRPGVSAAERKRILQTGGIRNNLDRAKQLYAQADQLANSGAIATVAAPGGGGSDIPQFLAGKGPHAPKTHDTTEQRAKEALRLQYEMDKEIADGQRDLLESQADLTNDYQGRADQAKEIANLEYQQKQRAIKFDLDMVLADKTISDKQKEEAKARAERASQLAYGLHVNELVKIENDRELQQQRDTNALEDQRFDARKDALQSEEQLATTASERRKIELELLDLAYQQRKAALEHIRNDMMPNGFPSHTPAEIAQAGVDLKSLDAGYVAAKQGVLNSTRGPIETFLAGIPKTAAEANEALQNIAVGGLQSLTDGLADAITGAKSLGQVFSSVAKQILADLIKIALQKAIVGTLGKVLGGLGGKTNALTGSGKSFITGSFSDILPGRAVGGPVGAGQPYIVGEKGPELFIPQLSGNIMTNSALRGRSATSPNGGGQTRISVVPSPYFNVVVDERAANIAIPIGAAASASGSADAQQTLVRRASRRLP